MTSRGFELHFLTLAFLTMGGRFGWTISLGKGVIRFVVVVVDYFTKWVEVEALSSVKCIERFLWKNVDMVFHMHSSQIMVNNSIVIPYEDGVPSFV